MPPPSNDPKGSKAKKPARRRKKKSRTEVSDSDSSSSSSSSSSSEDEGMKDVEPDTEDVAMMGVIDDDEAEKSSSGSEDEDGKKRRKRVDIEQLDGQKFLDAMWASDWKDLDKFPEEIPRRFPEGIEKFRDPTMDEGLVAAKFEEYYMKCITAEFGEDLDKLRTAKDFDDESVPMLLRLLKRGVNIFDDEEKNKVVADERKRWEEEEEKQRQKQEIERETAMERGQTRS
ncbi:hypothetical protein BJ508DRAFT_415763 [Ascobolus immersus RN42]|uniref:Ribosome assembly protein 3 n=1 Tax=Ascobolus immersus RN42 TaxID=1160509 RepID=A0A3N4I125_ASCIM|nr:hypothetical protein BJ508DRAFT_415763 [Ascobolus immersus RN42]